MSTSCTVLVFLSIKQFDSFVTNRVQLPSSSSSSYAFVSQRKCQNVLNFFTLFSFKVIAIEIVWKVFPGIFSFPLSFSFSPTRLYNNTIFPIELTAFVLFKHFKLFIWKNSQSFERKVMNFECCVIKFMLKLWESSFSPKTKKSFYTECWALK